MVWGLTICADPTLEGFVDDDAPSPMGTALIAKFPLPPSQLDDVCPPPP